MGRQRGQEGRREFVVRASNDEPAYLNLYRTGELQRRAQQALELLERCRLCPHDCGVNRLSGGKAVCRTGRYAVVSSYFAHFGEEACLAGTKGSGAIFFAWCNLRCVFCQNRTISHAGQGRETSPEQLAAMMLELQAAGCHNINLVTPAHVAPQFLEALSVAAAQGLRLPIVYNTSAYDALDSLRLLDGVVDIYMPDFKFWDALLALRYLKMSNYPDVARRAITEMQRQVGVLQLDESGLARRGVLVRHLVMPECLADTESILHFLAEEISTDTYVNLVDEYYPAGEVGADSFPEINRPLSNGEYRDALRLAQNLGLWRLDQRRFGLLLHRR